MGSYDAPDDFFQKRLYMAVVLFYHVWLFYLTDFTAEEQEDMYQGIMNWRYPCFFAFQGYCCVFRPYDQVRYIGIYNNCNLNGLFYLEVLAAIFGKILYVTKEISINSGEYITGSVQEWCIPFSL